MTPLIRKSLFLLLALSLSNGLAPLTAQAKDLRFPEKGFPAYAFVLPDDWSSQTDDSGNMIMASANRSTVLVILVGETTEDLDDIAKEALTVAKAAPYTRKEPADISGRKGHTYYTTVQNAQGDTLQLEMTIVRVDGNHIASNSLILSSRVTKADETTARIVKNGMKLVTE